MLLNEKLTVFSTQENDFGDVMEKSQLTSSLLKKGFQAADDLFKQFFEVDQFID